MKHRRRIKYLGHDNLLLNVVEKIISNYHKTTARMARAKHQLSSQFINELGGFCQ